MGPESARLENLLQATNSRVASFKLGFAPDACAVALSCVRTHIRHSETEAVPRSSIVYRSHICRLELVVDDMTQKLTVPPFPDRADDAPASGRRKRRRPS
jgi:hypothetical protein